MLLSTPGRLQPVESVCPVYFIACTFLQHLPTKVLINKIKESGKFIFHIVFNRVKFQSPSSWESRFQARQFFDGFQPEWI